MTYVILLPWLLKYMYMFVVLYVDTQNSEVADDVEGEANEPNAKGTVSANTFFDWLESCWLYFFSVL